MQINDSIELEKAIQDKDYKKIAEIIQKIEPEVFKKFLFLPELLSKSIK